jgi:hypothetical protein
MWCRLVPGSQDRVKFAGMPKRNRTKEQRSIGGPAVQRQANPSAAATPAVESDQARAARLFAQSVKAHEAADQVERDRVAAAAAHDRRGAELLAAKESAAALIRQLRADGRPRQKMADAEAAYRLALAELTEFETGERPHWAPPVPIADDAVAEDDPAADAATAEGSEAQPS